MALDILQVITTTDRRGAEVFGIELGSALTRRGWSVDTVALAPGGHVTALEVPVLGPRRLHPSTLWNLRRRARSAALVIAHGSTTLPACAVATARTGVPFLYRNIGDPEQWAASRVRRARSGVLLRRARAVVALTPAVAGTLVERYRLRPERVVAIPRGVPAEHFPPVDADARQRARTRFALPDDVAVALYIGALSPEKNVELAIEGIATLPDVHLLVVGDGPERGALEGRSGRRLRGRAHFMGSVDDPAVAFAAADVVVLPSRTEGLPGVLIEAGLSGLPAVATDVGWVREIVDDGVTGLVVPSDDPGALASAIRDALGDRIRLGGLARARCLQRYELEVVASAWSELLGGIMHELERTPCG